MLRKGLSQLAWAHLKAVEAIPSTGAFPHAASPFAMILSKVGCLYCSGGD